MVHRLQNWLLLRDLMCASKDTARYIIMESLRTVAREHRAAGRYHPEAPIREDIVKNMINNCGCVSSQDGLEVCLLTYREDLTPLFKCQGECPEFEYFLEILDKMINDIKETMAENHKL